MQAATQIHFFSRELFASNVGHSFAGVSGGYMVLLFCAASGWAHFWHTLSPAV